MARQFFATSIILAMITMLAGCGGGGVNSVGPVAGPPSTTPAPSPTPSPTPGAVTTTLTPLAPTNGLIGGTFDTIAVIEQDDGNSVTLSKADPGQVRIAIDPATKTYTVTTSFPGLSPSQAFDMGHKFNGGCCPDTLSEFGNHVVRKDASGNVIEQYDVTSGSSKDQTLDATHLTTYHLMYDLGLRYVSLGYWLQIDWKQVGPTSFSQIGQPNKIYFVNGERTPPGALPVAGTATYKLATTDNVADYFENFTSVQIPELFILTADFGNRSIAADLDVPETSYTDGDAIGGYETYYNNGYHASGSAPFSASGEFDISLTGEVLPDHEGKGGATLAGNVLGAFFGPNAENIGGVLQLTPDGSQTSVMPFAAQHQ